MVEGDSIISPSTSNSLLIQFKNNFVEVSLETLTLFQNNISSTPNFDPIASPYTLPPHTNRGQPPIKYESILNCKVKYPINNYASSKK